jgi:hypothetical protein
MLVYCHASYYHANALPSAGNTSVDCFPNIACLHAPMATISSTFPNYAHYSAALERCSKLFNHHMARTLQSLLCHCVPVAGKQHIRHYAKRSTLLPTQYVPRQVPIKVIKTIISTFQALGQIQFRMYNQCNIVRHMSSACTCPSASNKPLCSSYRVSLFALYVVSNAVPVKIAAMLSNRGLETGV